jgi:hypothetical protein
MSRGALICSRENLTKSSNLLKAFHKWKAICGITYHPLHPRKRMGYVVIDPLFGRPIP